MEIFHYDFILRAFLVGFFLSIPSAFLGVFLVLKRISLIGDGLSHVAFGSAALSLVLGKSPLFLTLPLVITSSFFIMRLNKSKMTGDVAIGLFSATFIAIALFAASLGQGFNIDLFSYLFGSILITTKEDIYLSALVFVLVFIFLFLRYRIIFSTVFDPDFSETIGINTRQIESFLGIFTGLLIAIGIKTVGSLLISSFLIFPAASSFQIAKGFKQTLIFAAFFGFFACFLGIFISFYLGTPAGASIVAFHTLIFLCCWSVKKIKNAY